MKRVPSSNLIIAVSVMKSYPASCAFIASCFWVRCCCFLNSRMRIPQQFFRFLLYQNAFMDTGPLSRNKNCLRSSILLIIKLAHDKIMLKKQVLGIFIIIRMNITNV